MINNIPNNSINYIIPSVFQSDTDLQMVYTIDYDDIKKIYISEQIIYFDYIKNNYKLLVILFQEDFFYNENVHNIIDYCIKIDLPLFVFSKNPTLSNFFKYKFDNNKLYSVLPQMLFLNSGNILQKINNTEKTIKLLFLNWNRKPNRDYIILKLKNKNELFNKDNYISFHNIHPLNSDKKYGPLESKFIEEMEIDIDFLKNFKLEPESVDLDNQYETQNKAIELYSLSKFNIICEPFFGYNNDINSYDYYNYIITNKTILPLVYRNVFFVHEYNTLLSTTLKNIGFELFFDNLDDFLNNMDEEYLNLNSTIDKLNHNQSLAIKLVNNEKKEFYYKLKELINEL